MKNIIICMTYLKCLILLVFIIISSSLFAKDNIEAERLKVMEEYYKEQGLPWPGGGIIIENKVTPEMKKNNHHTFTIINRFNHNVESMLNLDKKVKQEKNYIKDINDKHSTHLRHSLKAINSIMAYPFKGVPKQIMTRDYGIAPILNYKENQGWVGATQLFKMDSMNCQYTENNIKLSMAAMKIDENDIGYEVNNKYTETTISGNEESGYMYSVEWYDHNFFRGLQCAQITFSESIMSQVITAACKIDSYQ